MISLESCNSILTIVDRASKTNTKIGAMDNSILGACVIASTNHVVDNYISETGFVDAWRDSLLDSPVLGLRGPVTVKTDSGESNVIIPTTIHAKTIEEASDIISNATLTAMNHAQNVATPIISNFIDTINSHISENDEFVERYEVVDVNFSDGWDNPIVLSALDNFKSFGSVKPVLRSSIPQVAIPAEYAAGFKTGSNAIDTVVSSICNDLNTDIAGVISDIFNSNCDEGTYPGEYWRDMDKYLLKFLVSQWMLDNPIPGIRVDGGSWRSLSTRLTNAYGIVCSILLGTLKRDVEQNRLLYLHDIATDRVYVNGIVYDKWLNAGGSPELIFGCLMNQDYSGITYQGMIDNRDRIIAAWSSQHTAMRNANRSKREAIIREGSFNAILTEIDQLTTDKMGPGDTKSILVQRARETINGLTNYQLRNIDTCAIGIVCDVLFPHTPAKLLLLDVDSQLADDVEFQDALYAAAANYITDWIMGSVLIGKA